MNTNVSSNNTNGKKKGHIPISAGLWRELEHITMSLIGDIDFIPIGSAVGAEAVDWAVGKINHRFSPPHKYFARR